MKSDTGNDLRRKRRGLGEGEWFSQNAPAKPCRASGTRNDPLVQELWLHLSSGVGESALNMAWDEALLEHAARLGAPVLRTYRWIEPAVTFGYFQRLAEITALTPLRPLIRRPTGGGLVPHERDWTYSVVIPPSHARYGVRAEESYRQLHEWLQAAFAVCGIPTELAPGCDPTGPGQCFIGAERHDLLCNGRKIAGAAQRRNRLGLLIQGSVQPPRTELCREDWESALRQTRGAVEWQPLFPDLELIRRAEELAETKYRQPDYTGRR